MKKINLVTFSLFSIILIAFFVMLGCGDCKPKKVNKVAKTEAPKKLKKVTFYLENSGSMFGYVNGSTEYVEVVSELSQKLDWTKDNINTDFYFVNGDNELTNVGNNSSSLKNKLNITDYNCGNIKTSNLTEMFNSALNIAGGENISILISDGIYDVGDKTNPISALQMEVKGTSNKFVSRLKKSNIQTLMIKLTSDFSGSYCFGVKSGSEQINQKRPYYIWIFGESSLLNKYFADEYIVNKLKGYENLVRFSKIDTSKILYQATSTDKIGDFSFDKCDENVLNDAEKDRNNKGFQFTIAVDFSLLPCSEKYLTDTANYYCTNKYSIVSVKPYNPAAKKIYGLSFIPTHLIKVHTKFNPCGTLTVSLKNSIPAWIDKTSTDSDSNILGDTVHTFGFKYLTNAISDAYEYMFKQTYIVNLEITITN